MNSLLFNAKAFKTDIVTKRCIEGNFSFRQAAKAIGIGPVTLMRVEKMSVPDIDTFLKICKWLKSNPTKYFNI